MTDKLNYPNDIPSEEIESLIEGAAELQKQILRRYTQSVLEQMRYELWIAVEKCKMFEAECIALRNQLNTQKALHD